MNELLGIVVRLTFMYFYAMALLWFTGKRSIGDLTALDFVVTLILGDQFDNVFWGTIPVADGVVGVATIFILHFLTAYLTMESKPLRWLLNGRTKIPLLVNSRWQEEGMARERTSKEDVYSQLRLQGIEYIKEIEEGSWESNGEFSAIEKEEYKPVQKQDLERLKKWFK